MSRRLLLAGFTLLALAPAAQAREYYVGGPVHHAGMEIVANYLVGVRMAPMPADMPMGADVIHLEADVHATARNAWGFPDQAWIPYLTIDYAITKDGTDWHAAGKLVPMTADDGPHYADNLRMDGPGAYRVVYTLHPPVVNGFLRHTDKETGVPDWWPAFSETFRFTYPVK